MPGYSKWANVQHRRGARAGQSDRIFSKLARAIAFAVGAGGADPASNARLRVAYERARDAGMSRELADSAAARPAAPGMQPVQYEGYGPGGVAMIVDCLTDDRNRTVADVRQAFARNGGNLGAAGSVRYLFNEVGLMTFPPGTDVDRLIQVSLHAGAEDVVPSEDGSIEVLADPTEFEAIRAIITAGGFVPATAEVTQRAATPTRITGEAGDQMIRLVEALEKLDDVQSVYSNVEISNEVLARV